MVVTMLAAVTVGTVVIFTVTAATVGWVVGTLVVTTVVGTVVATVVSIMVGTGVATITCSVVGTGVGTVVAGAVICAGCVQPLIVTRVTSSTKKPINHFIWIKWWMLFN
jgi:hypothetical protein